jgi:hypothetical protein
LKNTAITLAQGRGVANFSGGGVSGDAGRSKGGQGPDHNGATIRLCA